MSATPPKSVETLSFGDLITKEFPPGNFIIDNGLFPKNGLLMVGGPPKSYKSFLLQAMTYHLVTGTNIFGATRYHGGQYERVFNVSKPQRVLFMEQEIGFYDVKNRLFPMLQTMPKEHREMFKENLFIHSCDYTANLDTQEGVRRMDTIIKTVKPDIVMLDPLIEFHSSDENSTQSMTKILRNVDLLKQQHDFSGIVSHHTGKPDIHGLRSGPDMLRGNSAIFGKGDSFLMLTPTNRNQGQIRIDFTIRRGVPIHPMNVILSWDDLLVRFHNWQVGKGGSTLEPVDLTQ